MPDPLIASAFVKIKPEPKSVSSFGKDVRGAIAKSFAKPVRIPVTVNLLPFKAKIQAELSSAVFTVKVTPVLAPGFKAQVAKLSKEAAAGVTVPVRPVVTGAAAAAAAGAAARPPAPPKAPAPRVTTAAQREEDFRKKLVKLTEQQTAAVTALTKAEQIEGGAKQKLSGLSAAVTKAENSLNAALALQAKLEGTLTQKQSARLATRVKSAEADLQAATAAKAAAKGAIDQAAADKLAEKTTTTRIGLEQKLALILANRAEAEAAGALVTGKVAVARAELATITAQHNALTTLSGEVTKFHNKVLTEESLALQKVVTALVEKAAAEKTAAQGAVRSAIADEEAAAAALHRAAAQKQLEKGLIATALAAAGARGATLAASFEFLAGAAAATAFFKSVQLAARLEEELNVFAVTAGATADEMERVAAAARRLGADVTLPAVSANDAAVAMTELAKAGLSVQDSIDAARGTLQLGTAAQIDNATAVNITASALNAFGLEGTQAVHVADLLAGAARESQGGIGDMGGALSSVASVARQAGVSIEDTVALLTLLAKNGIQGAESGTALRVAMLRLIAPTDKARKKLAELNVQVLDANGNMRPEVFTDLANATAELGANQRNAALQIIFGTRAIRAQAVLGREGAAGLNAMRDATNQQGLAAEDAAARTQGFTGDIEAFKNSLASLGLIIGGVSIPLLSDLTTQLTEVAGGAIDAADALGKMKAALPGGGGGFTDLFSPGFDPGLFDVGLKGTAARIKEIRASIDLVRQGNLGKALKEGLTGDFDLPSQQVADFSDKAAEATKSADEMAIALRNLAPKEGRGDIAAQIDFLESLKKQITGTGEEADAARARIDALLRLTAALGRTPTALEIKVLFEKGGIDDALLDAQRVVNATRMNLTLGLDKKSVVFLGHDAAEAAKVAAVDAEQAFRIEFGDAMAADPIGRAIWDPFFLSGLEPAADAGKKTAAAFSLGFSTEIAVLEATGAGQSQILAKLKEKLVIDESVLRRARAKFEKNKTKENKDFVDRAAKAVIETQDQIDSIVKDQQQQSKQKADDVKEARSKADQAFLDALGLKQGRLANAILRAEGTASLQDDIKTHTALRDAIKKSLDEASKTIQDAQLKAETIQSLTKDLIAENQTLVELNRQLVDAIATRFEARIDIAQITGNVKKIRKLYAEWIKELRKALAEATKGSQLARELKLKILQTQQAAFDAINEGFELDIQIAEAQERPRAEVRARERFIEQLKREQDQFRKGSLEWKRLQLEIVQQRKAIQDAKKALAERNNAFAQLAFEFLTTQQGFAANVLGNLLPMGAIGGTVAGNLAGKAAGPPGASAAAAAAGIPVGVARAEGVDVSRGTGRATGGPGAFLGESSRRADADRVGGFTAAQAATLIALTTQIVRLLGAIDSKGKHPEAKRQHRMTDKAFDTAPGGP